MVQNEIIKQAIANMILLEIPMEYIRDFESNGKTYLIDGRTATEINPMTYPKLNDFVESVKERNGTVVYGVFNEPNMYGEKTDKYILLCLDKSAIKSPLYQIRQKGQIYTTVAYGWCESTGIAEPTVVCFQVSNEGVWCLPYPIAQKLLAHLGLETKSE